MPNSFINVENEEREYIDGGFGVYKSTIDCLEVLIAGTIILIIGIIRIKVRRVS